MRSTLGVHGPNLYVADMFYCRTPRFNLYTLNNLRTDACCAHFLQLCITKFVRSNAATTGWCRGNRFHLNLDGAPFVCLRAYRLSLLRFLWSLLLSQVPLLGYGHYLRNAFHFIIRLSISLNKEEIRIQIPYYTSIPVGVPQVLAT
jgi:hypothetical protein